MMRKHGLGYLPDLGDPRDYAYKRVLKATQRPKSVDLRPKMPPVWDQGQLGSCTAFALTGAVAFLHGFTGSQLWLYYKERVLEHTTRQDAGAMIRDGIKVLAKTGLPPEAAWPYQPAKFAKRPSAAANKAAKQELIGEYRRLNGVNDYLDCLASGSPFVVGISVFESFESDAVAANGEVPMPASSEQMLGGHAICVCGYRPDGSFIVRNSWGKDWGAAGYFFLPNAYLASADLATDAWAITACSK
jgi:C1A family cysteine protease